VGKYHVLMVKPWVMLKMAMGIDRFSCSDCYQTDLLIYKLYDINYKLTLLSYHRALIGMIVCGVSITFNPLVTYLHRLLRLRRFGT
jgi:hypothetical protein